MNIRIAYHFVSMQVHMFLSKLTSTSIGFTAWDMVVINKPTVLMVLYVTIDDTLVLKFFYTRIPTQCRIS